ncbi:hypothetical protein Y032_0023g696 [Ancylostoma ceylanicum]|nr:hypothetical protein Y032_0023g696 [Ancylostoma ceylanicum]
MTSSPTRAAVNFTIVKHVSVDSPALGRQPKDAPWVTGLQAGCASGLMDEVMLVMVMMRRKSATAVIAAL